MKVFLAENLSRKKALFVCEEGAGDVHQGIISGVKSELGPLSPMPLTSQRWVHFILSDILRLWFFPLLKVELIASSSWMSLLSCILVLGHYHLRIELVVWGLLLPLHSWVCTHSPTTPTHTHTHIRTHTIFFEAFVHLYFSLHGAWNIIRHQ